MFLTPQPFPPQILQPINDQLHPHSHHPSSASSSAFSFPSQSSSSSPPSSSSSSSSSAPLTELQHCSGCGCLIMDSQLIRLFPDRFLHDHCAVCSVCNTALLPRNGTAAISARGKCYERDGRLFCHTHYFQEFVPKTKCTGCKSLIRSDELAYKLKTGIIYHVHCLRCVRCKKKLGRGDRTVPMEQQKGVQCAEHVHPQMQEERRTLQNLKEREGQSWGWMTGIESGQIGQEQPKWPEWLEPKMTNGHGDGTDGTRTKGQIGHNDQQQQKQWHQLRPEIGPASMPVVVGIQNSPMAPQSWDQIDQVKRREEEDRREHQQQMIGERIGINGLTLLIGPGGSPAPPRSCSSGSSATSSAHPSTVAGTPSPRHLVQSSFAIHLTLPNRQNDVRKAGQADPPPPPLHHQPQHPFLLSLPSANHPLVSPPNSLPTHSPQNPESVANKKCPRSDSPMRPKSNETTCSSAVEGDETFGGEEDPKKRRRRRTKKRKKGKEDEEGRGAQLAKGKRTNTPGPVPQYPFEMYAVGEQFSRQEEDEQQKVQGGKRRGPRTTISQQQLDALNRTFATTPKPSKHARAKLALDAGLSMRVIQVWFQNRRSKERRLKHLCNFLRHCEGQQQGTQQQQKDAESPEEMEEEEE